MSLFDLTIIIYPVLSSTNKEKLEAMNRKIFRIIHRWNDATKDEIIPSNQWKYFHKLTTSLNHT